MLDTIALVILGFSVLLLIYSSIDMKKGPKTTRRGKRDSKEKSPSPHTKDKEMTPVERKRMEMLIEEEPSSSTRDESGEMTSRPTGAKDTHGREIFDETMASGSSITPIERKASLIYWERMSLEEEYDLTVNLHKPEFKVTAPDGARVHESESIYKIARTGHVRVIPVCSGCNISPAYRDIKVNELDTETEADFKVLPIEVGEHKLTVEFQIVHRDGKIENLGVEITIVQIQPKPIQVNIGTLNISVSRRIPAFFSICGSFFGLISFVLARLGVNVNEEIFAWSLTLGSGIAGAVMILIVLMLLIKGIRPLMNEISITLK